MRTDGRVVGRRGEVAAIDEFLADSRTGPAVLRIDGEPGIGKSTLWELAVGRAADGGARVLRCRPGASEHALPLTAIGDLLGDSYDDIAAALPPPQASALGVALGVVDGSADGRLLGIALVSALRLLAESAPVLVAIDDAQWLDASSVAALSYSARRLDGEPVGWLVARRSGDSDGLDVREGVAEGNVRSVSVGPLERDELGELVRLHLDVVLPRPALEVLREVSGGNAFYALEIARASSPADLSAGRARDLPSTLRALVQGRLSALSDLALEVVLVAAASPRPTVTLLRAVLDSATRVDDGLAEAEDADVLVSDGDLVAFRHPLLASTVYTTTAATRRRLLHERLATVVTSLEERAHHLARATTGPDRDAAQAVEDAASAAAARGGPADAARLADEAVGLTPDGDVDDLRRRLFAAAGYHFEAGSALAAKAALERAAACSAPGLDQAEAIRRLAGVLRSTDGVQAAVDAYEDALELAADDPRLRAAIHQALGWMRCFQGSVEGTKHHASAALAAIEELDEPDPTMLMEVLSSVAESQFHAGLDEYRATIERALELEAQHPTAVVINERPSAYRASHLIREDELAAAHDIFESLHAAAVETSDDASRIDTLIFLGTVESYTGDLVQAQEHLDAAHLGAVQSGQEAQEGGALGWRTYVHAQLGLVDEARRDGARALDIAIASGSMWLEARVRGHLGFLELSLGDVAAAQTQLDRADEKLAETGVREPGTFHLVPDYVETLAALGDVDRAEAVLRDFEALAIDRQRGWALAAAYRCRALLLASSGSLDEAIEAAERAVAAFEKLPYPLERGRALLVLGSVQRRAKRKAAARNALDLAVAAFREIGAALWVDRAGDELTRISGRTRGGLELTESERRVAELVASGLTNREVADRLFLSPRTVESNLSKVYRKLNVRSRVELVQALAETPPR